RSLPNTVTIRKLKQKEVIFINCNRELEALPQRLEELEEESPKYRHHSKTEAERSYLYKLQPRT
ncbi:hypothetical protein QBJ84_18800, partial [Vibrio sp. NO3-D2]|nr:hypothetical protein [Vibrio sp. NO3-D2]